MLNDAVECVICGESFETIGKNEKYCSPLCRATGAKQVREEWERKTDYKGKQRQRMREKRKEEQIAVRQHERRQQTKIAEVSQKEEEHRKKRQFDDIRKKADQGDLSALQELARVNGDTLEYWRLYKEIMLKPEREFGHVGRHFVSGIDIHEENFEYIVVEQLENEKRMRSDRA